MSTKSSFAYSDNFHLYAECFDDNNVYLEVEGVEFETSSGRVMVSIPLEIWEVIRQYSNIDLSLVNKNDDEIKADCEVFVKDRLAKIEACKAHQGGRGVGLLASMGCVVYGTADEAVETQIQSGFDYMIKRRNEQQDLLLKIEALKSKQRK